MSYRFFLFIYHNYCPSFFVVLTFYSVLVDFSYFIRIRPYSHIPSCPGFSANISCSWFLSHFLDSLILFLFSSFPLLIFIPSFPNYLYPSLFRLSYFCIMVSFFLPSLFIHLPPYLLPNSGSPSSLASSFLGFS